MLGEIALPVSHDGSPKRYYSTEVTDLSDDLLVRHHVLVPTDNAFQRRARFSLGALAHQRALPIGDHRGRPLGSRLAMPSAKNELTNYLTETIRDVVRREVLDAARREGKLYGQPRIFNDRRIREAAKASAVLLL